MKKLLLLLFLAIGPYPFVFGWDKAGHSLTAAIACHDLETRHPEVLPKLVAIMQKASDFSQQLDWKNSIDHSSLSKDSKGEALMLLMLAARWPDDIKGDGSHRDKSPHDTHPWHYINLPISLDGTNAPQAKEPNILTASAKLRTEWATATTPEQKSNILCFLTHFIGDSHQPLHSTEAFSKEFPKGDAGGGLWTIHSVNGVSKLHGFWDDVVIKGEDAAAVAAKVNQEALRIAQQHPRASFPQIAKNRDMRSWIQNETFPLAKKHAYLDGKLTEPRKGSPTLLPESYKTNAKQIAESQMALAGYRIADMLYELLR